MATKLRDKIKTFSKESQERITNMAEELVEEELTLRDLRKQRRITQEQVAKLLGVGQENVSRLERRNNIHVSTLKDYIHALGGKLHLVVEFPEEEPIKLRDEYRENEIHSTSSEKI